VGNMAIAGLQVKNKNGTFCATKEPWLAHPPAHIRGGASRHRCIASGRFTGGVTARTVNIGPQKRILRDPGFDQMRSQLLELPHDRKIFPCLSGPAAAILWR
jgi:hypothetical protein